MSTMEKVVKFKKLRFIRASVLNPGQQKLLVKDFSLDAIEEAWKWINQMTLEILGEVEVKRLAVQTPADFYFNIKDRLGRTPIANLFECHDMTFYLGYVHE